MSLKTNYEDVVFSGKKVYQLSKNENGNYNIKDKTEYEQSGAPITADDINALTAEVNRIVQTVDAWD